MATLSGISLSFFIGQTSTSVTYNTATVLEGFNVDSAADLIDAYGFLQHGPGCMLGLSSQASSDNAFTLADLFKLVSIDALLDGSTQVKLCKERQNISGLPEPINGMWYYPQSNNKTIFTLCAKPVSQPENDRLIGLPFDLPGCHFTNQTIMVTKTGYLTRSIDSSTGEMEEYVNSFGSFSIQTQLTLRNSDVPACQCWIGVSPTDLSLTLQWVKVRARFAAYRSRIMLSLHESS